MWTGGKKKKRKEKRLASDYINVVLCTALITLICGLASAQQTKDIHSGATTQADKNFQKRV